MSAVELDGVPGLDRQLVEPNSVSVHELIAGNPLLDVHYFAADLDRSGGQLQRDADFGVLWKLIRRAEGKTGRIQILGQCQQLTILSAFSVRRVHSDRERIDKPVIDALLAGRAAVKHNKCGEVNVPRDPETIEPEGERGPTGGVVVYPAISARQCRPNQRKDRHHQQYQLRGVRFKRNIVRSLRCHVELERFLSEEASVRFYVGPELRHVVALGDQDPPGPARQQLERDNAEQHVGYEAGHELRARDVHRQPPGAEEDNQRQITAQLLDPVEIRSGRREVGQTLWNSQAWINQGIQFAQDLHRTLPPTQSLDVIRERRRWGESVSQGLAVINRLPASAVEYDRCLHVLGDRLGRESADLFESRAPKHAAAAAEKRRVPAVLPRLKEREEDPILFPQAPALFVHDVSERIGIVEVLRRLNERDSRVAEVAKQTVEDVRQRDVVRVELENELAARESDGMVEVTRFGVRVSFTPDVFDPQRLGHRLDLFALAVVEHVGAVRILDRAGSNGSAPRNLERS